MTPKEIFLELLKKDGRPERLLDQYEALYLSFGDPISRYVNEGVGKGKTAVNKWGVTVTWPEDAPGSIPVHSEEKTVLKDITHWRDYVHAPDIEAHCQEGWDEFRERKRAKCGDDHILCGYMATGMFEQCHFLMGFEDTLTNLYEHPKEMHELIDYIADYRIRYAKMLIDNLHPDAIFSHDDWGAKTQLFMKPEIWREFFKEPYRRFYGMIRDAGVIAIHHSDSYLVPILDDMVEIGIQCWQGILPENNIPEVIRYLDGRMAVMGGIGAAIDRADAAEEEVRAYVRDVLQTDGPLGHFIPSITYGIKGTVFPHVDPYIDDEIAKYNAEVHIPHYNMPVTGRKYVLKPDRSGDDKGTADDGSSAALRQNGFGEGVLADVAEALWKGNKSRTLRAVRSALDEGHTAQEILGGGLIRGMQKVGDDFTDGNLFVSEMLLSAKCMTAAIDLLRPHMTGDSAEQLGRVCIGTVKGDLHDIGKNLVKIMLEGSGFDVIDLGSDVSAGEFVETAKTKHCDFICCSSLLTTTMGEMGRVVELAKEAGIRDQVKIMVGGAPVTQSFCDEIGADIYTDDAAEAARAAVEAVQS